MRITRERRKIILSKVVVRDNVRRVPSVGCEPKCCIIGSHFYYYHFSFVYFILMAQRVDLAKCSSLSGA